MAPFTSTGRGRGSQRKILAIGEKEKRIPTAFAVDRALGGVFDEVLRNPSECKSLSSREGKKRCSGALQRTIGIEVERMKQEYRKRGKREKSGLTEQGLRGIRTISPIISPLLKSTLGERTSPPDYEKSLPSTESAKPQASPEPRHFPRMRMRDAGGSAITTGSKASRERGGLWGEGGKGLPKGRKGGKPGTGWFHDRGGL